MRKIIIHHVKRMGDSEYTDCGLKYINSGRSATQNGEVTCKECIKELNKDSETTDGEKDGN